MEEKKRSRLLGLAGKALILFAFIFVLISPYTLVLSGIIFLIGAVFLVLGDDSFPAKALWIILPVISYYPVLYGLDWLLDNLF